MLLLNNLARRASRLLRCMGVCVCECMCVWVHGCVGGVGVCVYECMGVWVYAYMDGCVYGWVYVCVSV